MRTRELLTLPTLLFVCFLVTAFTVRSPRAAAAKASPENQSVSGKIASVGDAEFTVAVPKDKSHPGSGNVEFFVDDNTRVEGKLAVGAQALIEYHSDSGRNIAVHVVITTQTSSNVSQQGVARAQ